MNINYHDLKQGSLAEWLLIEAVAYLNLGIDTLPKMDVVLTINGIEAPFLDLMSEIDKQYAAIVLKTAEDLFQDQLYKLSRMVDETYEALSNTFDEAARKAHENAATHNR